jgi:thiosulfate dehydrogenase
LKIEIMEPEKKFNEAELHAIIRRLLNLVILLAAAIVLIPVILYSVRFFSTKQSAGDQVPERELVAPTNVPAVPLTNYWTAPDVSTISDPTLKAQIEYGKDLIAHTSKYLGPNGSVAQLSNGLNCQNCHLNAGTKVFGNNYGSVASTYPKMRARSGSVENIYKRVNDCFERSLNGKALDTTSKEMQAIVAYINFLGANVEKGKKAEGSGFKDLAYLDRAADPEKGKAVYETKCQSCHQANGEGLLNPEKTEYTFPALWGKGSYNDGAGLYRISNFAKYVKYNMPQGVSHDSPQLSDEESWDVAAFVNSQPRPHINVPKDWPDKSKKPVDHPFGPYADKYPEKQHKFGPFQPIADDQKKNSEK